ncbi:MAG: LLM class F420-dependent oxidoreductase [Alphaproteobacteria bacterium]|nr:LLM class F420-dependent oxidoreductase [Alphaproteobacteria bacterium]
MQVGAAMFFTDYSMRPAELGRALEERGFESLWAPEHSHIPLSRKSPFPSGGELPKQYYDVMDPFVALTAAAAVTKKLKLGTGVCLIIQRDTIQTAKLVASLDQVSGGRFLFGIGGGWNQDEMEDHGTAYATRFKKMREQVEAMKAIWTENKPEYRGEIVEFPPMMTWPKPAQKPHPPVIVGGMFPHAARRALRYGNGWIPHSRRPQYEDVTDYLPHFRQMAAEAGRDPTEVPITVWGIGEDAGRLRRYREQGVARVVVSLPSEPAGMTLPVLDRWVSLISGIKD